MAPALLSWTPLRFYSSTKVRRHGDSFKAGFLICQTNIPTSDETPANLRDQLLAYVWLCVNI